MNQSEFLLITCYFLKAREKSRLQGAIAFGFATHWLKKWREAFKPITKRSNCNRVITCDCHLKLLCLCCDWPRNRLAFSSLLTTLSQSATSIGDIFSPNCSPAYCRSDSPIETPYQSISEDDITAESVRLISSAPMPTTVRNLIFSYQFRQ